MCDMPRVGLDMYMCDMPRVGLDMYMCDMSRVGLDMYMCDMPRVGLDMYKCMQYWCVALLMCAENQQPSIIYSYSYILL